MKLRIKSVAIPLGSTIGYGIGVPVNDPTKEVLFAGDQGALIEIVEAMATVAGADVIADVPDDAVLAVRELPRD